MTSEKAYSVEARLNALIAAGVDSTITDTGITTVTQATDNLLSASFTIPTDIAGPNLGTEYELVAFGSGTWGSTQQALTLNPQLGGTTAGNTTAIGQTQFNAGAGFRWQFRFIALCTATGAGGAFVIGTFGGASVVSGNILSGIGNNASLGFANGSTPSQSIDTTAPFTMKLTASWASTTGSPSITCRGTLLHRRGP